MCDDSDFELGLPPDFCNTPELQAAWRRVEAFDASRPVSEKLAGLLGTLGRMAQLLDAEQSASLDRTRAQLDAWQKRVRDMPPDASRAEVELLDKQTLSFILGEPALHAAYEAASGLEMLEIVVPQLAALKSQAQRSPLSADERRHLGVLKKLRATLDEQVRDGLSRLRSPD